MFKSTSTEQTSSWEAQRLLSDMSLSQLSNYQLMKQIIADRYESKEKDVAYRCQLRYRKREKR